MKKEIFCTIFTPTYNRKELLKRLYQSLLIQNKKNFEWVIVDDGSSDDTESYINSIIKECKEFKINYIKQENGGKHRAINLGLDLSKGIVFAIVDSDDYLTEDATEKIENAFIEILNNNEKKFAGVAFQKGYNNNQGIGTTFNGEYVDATSLERDKLNIRGDKFEVFYTNILREHRFPEFSEEKFLTEAVVWNRIAANGYNLRWYNDIIYICEYLPGGLTDSTSKLINSSPKGFILYIKEKILYGQLGMIEKFKLYSYYCKYRKEKIKINQIAKELNINILILYFIYYVRCFLEKIRRENGRKKI